MFPPTMILQDLGNIKLVRTAYSKAQISDGEAMSTISPKGVDKLNSVYWICQILKSVYLKKRKIPSHLIKRLDANFQFISKIHVKTLLI